MTRSALQVTRRGAIGLVGAGALGLLIPVARVHAADRPLSPPTGSTILRHRNWRPLVGDASLSTERNYAIRFTPLAEGFRVEGEQVSSSIDAPADLAPLAELWRKQVNTGMFPFSLDAGGLIVPDSGPAAAPIPGFDEMIDTGIEMLRKSGQTEAQVHDAKTFFLWLQLAAAQIVTDVPLDLFVPPAEPEQTSRTIELPGGGSGTIEVRFQGSRSPETRMMAEATREVITSTEGTSQRIVDRWALLPA